MVPYHDLRTVASAHRGEDLQSFPGSVAGCRGVAAASQAELRRREQRDCDVAISDVFDQPRAADMATINHPGNRVLIELARRIQLALGRPVAPPEPSALAALGLAGHAAGPAGEAAGPAGGDPAGPAGDWLVGGRPVSAASIHHTQLQWYRDNPQVVEAGYLRHRDTLATLGLA